MSTLQKGVFLIAMPTLLDPNFRQTVVLLCEHGPEGSMGIVVNRPMDATISLLLPADETLRGRQDRVFAGGPVQTGVLMMLYRGEALENAVPVFGDLHLTGDPEMLSRADGDAPPSRFYLGYAGWSPGQLETEMGTGCWGILPADPGPVFSPDPLVVWPRIIRHFGREWAVYSDMPPDPSLN